jgi:hypothetical protein
MKPLIERLPERIARLEAKYGSEAKYVKSLKEQLRAMKANQGKTAEQVFKMQALQFPEESDKKQT